MEKINLYHDKNYLLCITQIICEKKNKRLMLKVYQAKFRKSYQYCFLSKQIIARLIFFAHKWKHTSTALRLTLEGGEGGAGVQF